MGLEPTSVRPCVRASTLSNLNISVTSRPITIKFYLKHHWDAGKAVLGFGADQIRTLVSMATDSSHRVIMGKRASSHQDQDQDSLLVKRRNDNHSPGPVIRELVPSSHQRSELSNTILCIFSG